MVSNKWVADDNTKNETIFSVMNINILKSKYIHGCMSEANAKKMASKTVEIKAHA